MVNRINRAVKSGLPDTLQFVQDWSQLKQDTAVCLVRNGRTTGIGRVDTPARNGRVFWIRREDGIRSMVLRADGIEVFTR